MRNKVTLLKKEHIPTSLLPSSHYKSVEDHGGILIEGLPPGVNLMQPGRYGINTPAEILKNKHHLKLIGMYIYMHCQNLTSI